MLQFEASNTSSHSVKKHSMTIRMHNSNDKNKCPEEIVNYLLENTTWIFSSNHL